MQSCERRERLRVTQRIATGHDGKIVAVELPLNADPFRGQPVTTWRSQETSALTQETAHLTLLTSAVHPKCVRLVLRRLAAVVCMLAFAHSAWAQCAGWQGAPDARRQCCQSGACPLHHHEDPASRTQLTQTAADDCCAQSPRHESSSPGTVFASTMTLAVLEPLPPVVLRLAPAAPLSAPWETPSPPAHVPKHLLLSVLLV